MNIAEILKDCPKGTKLYSPLFGEVEFKQILHINDEYTIVVSKHDNSNYRFYSNGIYWKYNDAECLLFPSKDNRDWSTFNTPKKENECKFKPFDKVLVRDRKDQCWKCNLFDHIDNDSYDFCCSYGIWAYCIPYEGNEHLVGTTNNPE